MKLIALALTLALTGCAYSTEAPPNDVPVVDDGGVDFEIDLDSKRKTVTVQKPQAPAPRQPAPAPKPAAPAPAKK